MKTFHKWVMLCALLLAAMISYSYGFAEGIIAFILIGIVFELTFWFKLFKKKPPVHD